MQNEDFTGVNVLPPEKPNQEITRQKTKTGKSLSVTSPDKDFHVDYRPEANRLPTSKHTRRCRTCGGLCAANSWEVHTYFCKTQFGCLNGNTKFPPVLAKIAKNKNGVYRG
jgi:hypothetical protein